MKVLAVTDHLPGHDLGFQKSGHARYLRSFFDHFARRGDEVTLIVFRPQVDFVVAPARELGVHVIGPAFARIGPSLVVRSPRAAGRWLAWSVFGRLPQGLQAGIDTVRRRLRRARGAVHQLGRFIAPRETAYVRAAVARLKPDLIVYDGIFNSCGHLGDVPHWLITHEVKHQRAASFAGQGVDVASSGVSAALEASLLAPIDTVIAIHWDDARELQRLAPAARVVVVPAAMDLPAQRAVADAVHGRCVFVGSGSYHNYDGITWFLEAAWPAIRAAVPDATLEIFGSVCLRIGEVPAGVSLRGVVDDLDGAYEAADVTIVPLRIGSGLKVKVVEAFAHAQAVVTTPVGAQGLMELEPRPFVLAAPNADFAAATIALLQTPARRSALRAAALRCAEAFTPAAAFGALEATR